MSFLFIFLCFNIYTSLLISSSFSSSPLQTWNSEIIEYQNHPYFKSFPNQDDIDRWQVESMDDHLVEDVIYKPSLPHINETILTERYNSIVEEMDEITYQSNLRASLFAAASYCRKSKIANWSCGYRCEGLTKGTQMITQFSILRTDAVGYIAIQPKQNAIILAFRGSLTLRNWFNNFKFHKTSLKWPGVPPNIRVHRGFYVTYNSARDFIHAYLSQLIQQYPSYHIEVMGHSLGGALVVLAALDLRLYIIPKHTPIHFYTFGQPRVGDENFRAFFISYFPNPLSSTRIVNNHDLVPQILPTFLSYTHMVRENWIILNQKKNLLCSKTNGEDPSCSFSLKKYQLSTLDHATAWNTTFGPFC